MLILRAVFVVFMVVLLGIGANALVDETGTIFFSWQGWAVESTAIILLTCLAVVLLLGFYLGVMVEWFVELPKALGAKRNRQKDKTKFDVLSEGLEALLAGDTPVIRKTAALLKKEPETKRIAQFITLMGGQTKPQEYTSAFLSLFSHMEDARQQGAPAAVRQYAERALEVRPESPKIQAYLLEALLQEHLWEQALAFLPQVSKKEGWSSQKKNTYTAFVFLQQAIAEKEDESALKILEKALKATPKNAAVVLEKARRLLVLEKEPAAERALAHFWGLAPRLDVFCLWIQTLQAQNLKKEKMRAKGEKLIKPLLDKKEHGAVAMLCGAVFYQKIGDTEKAKELAEKAIKKIPNREGYEFLARIDVAGAENWLKKALSAPCLPQAQEDDFQAYQALSHKYMSS